MLGHHKPGIGELPDVGNVVILSHVNPDHSTRYKGEATSDKAHRRPSLSSEPEINGKWQDDQQWGFRALN